LRLGKAGELSRPEVFQIKQLADLPAGRFRGFQIDDQLEFRRLLDRQVGRFSALEDLVDVVGREPEPVGDASLT